MKKLLKQVVGIDVASKELVVSLGRIHDDFSSDIYAGKAFANSAKGFSALITWVNKSIVKEVTVRFVMEATGIYHEALAYFLHQEGLDLSVVLPNKISNYMRTLQIKTITDKTASEAITRFGLERQLNNWQKPKDIYRQLKQLTRERDQLVIERTAAKNQLHAEKSEAVPNPHSIKRIKERIRVMDRQEQEIQIEIDALVACDPEVQEAVELICTIPGIGVLTAVVILAETNGFELIRSRRQLASYAGFDIVQKQSGTSVNGKPRISKKGNRYLRKAMHLPALSALRYDEKMKVVFARLVSKHGIKMKAGIAVQRKLLEMAFTIYKTKTPYDKEYQPINMVKQEAVTP